MLYQLLGWLAKMLLTKLGNFSITHKHVLPENQGYILTCSHKGWVDVVALSVALWPIPIHFMAKKELFQRKWIRKFLFALNAFPVNRENPSPKTIKLPVKLLKEGKIVGIFPSGTRTEEDLPFKRGAVTIANLANVPIVPAAYKGPKNLKELWKRKKIKIIFGEPIYFHKKMTKEELIEKTNELSLRIQHLEKI